MENREIVIVEWLDSVTSTHNWVLEKDLEFEDTEPVKIITCGIIVKNTEKYIVVAQNYGYSPNQFCNTITIPKGCITKIDKLDCKNI